MKIVVTGGAGFIGSNFIYYMLDKYKDYKIICIDKLTYAGNLSTLSEAMKNQNFKFIKADICDIEKIDTVFKEEEPNI
ncbi:MAG: GDP-mannose 4,6-dehydratase, partial [Intestinibacter sp.]